MTTRTKCISRRKALSLLGGTAGAFAVAPMINLGSYRLFENSQDKYSARAVELVERSQVIDMLCPLTLNFPKMNVWMRDPDSFTVKDWEPYKESGINIIHPAVGMGGVTENKSVLTFFAAWNSFIANNDRYFMRIDSASDFEKLKQTEKTGVILGLQNSNHFQRVNDVNLFHGIGQRVSQLTYNSRNMIGSGSTERSDGGLSDFGVRVLERMQGIGMAADVSHCGDRTTLDAFAVAEKPVLITHSNCRSLVPGHPRCKTDEMIKKMAESGGVMGITGVRMFVKDSEPTTIEHALDHFDHVARLVGVERLGVGSDMDLNGYDDMPEEQLRQLRSGYKDSYAFRDKIDIEGIDHPKRMYDLTEGLIRRGYSNDDIEGILGGNFKRVLSDLWIS